MHLITGKKGEPHVTSENHGFLNSRLVGRGGFVFDFSYKFGAIKLNNNSVQIRSGQGMLNGRHFEIEEGQTESVSIDSGTVGMNRNDIIVARYEKAQNGYESMTLVAVKGTPVSGVPSEPSVNDGNILNGDTVVDFPMYRVKIVDTDIDSIEQMFTVVDFDIAAMQEAVTETLENVEETLADLEDTLEDVENKPYKYVGHTSNGEPFYVPVTDLEKKVSQGDLYLDNVTNYLWYCYSITKNSSDEVTHADWIRISKDYHTPRIYETWSAPTTNPSHYTGVEIGDILLRYDEEYTALVNNVYIAEIVTTLGTPYVSWREIVTDRSEKWNDYYTQTQTNTLLGDKLNRTDGIKIFFGTEPTASTTQGAVGGDIFFAGHTGSNRQWVFKNLYVCEEYSGTKTWKKIAVGEFYTKTQTDTLLNAKQDTLTAGNNITIDANNVISATGGSGGTTEKIFDEDSTNPIGNDTLLEVFESGVLDKYEMVSEPVILTPEWELGAFNSVGEKSDSNQRSRITNPIEITNTITIDSLSSVGYAYCVYNENMTFNSQKSHTNNYLTEQTTIEPASDAKYINIWNNSSDPSRANEFIQIGLEIDEPTKMEVTEKVMYTKNEIDAMVLNYWKSKNIAWIGDSIPHGQISGGNVQTPYPNIVSNNLGGVLTNYSIGGTVFASKTNYGGAFSSRADFDNATKDTSLYYDIIEGQSYYSLGWDSERSVWAQVPIGTTRTPLSERIKLMNANMDLVCVHCGTNDFQYNWTDIGTMSDRTNHTFYGALHNCCLQLLEKYLAKQIIFLTPIKRAQTPYTTTESENDYNKTLKDYCEIIKEVCDYYSIPVIDLYSISTLNPQLNIQSSLFDNVKTHPLQTGHNILAGIVTSQIKGFRSY